MMTKALTKEELAGVWYGIIMCTVPGRRHRGLAAKLVMYVQQLSRNSGHSFWLEAGSPESRRLYLKLGFEDVGEVVLGKGVVGPDGLAKQDGEGIKTWAMIWRPSMEGKKVERNVRQSRL